MPLTCNSENQKICSFNLNDDEWKALRTENKKSNFLKFSCCDANVILKISPLGTKYFAHARKGNCISAPETVEHILAKSHIIEAVKKTKWLAESEANPQISEITPTGREWQADVLATNNKHKVAFEVQWSRQSIAETKRRHERYKLSDVRCLWLFRQYDFRSDRETPAFQIRYSEIDKSFFVYIQSYQYNSMIAKDERCWSGPIPLRDFIEGCLTGNLKYAPVIGKTVPLEVLTTNKQCKRCKKYTNIITGLNFLVESVLHNCPNIPASIYTEGLDKYLLKWLPARLLKAHIVGKLKVRKSYMRIEGEASYFSNGCFHCDGIQPKYYENEYFDIEEPLIKINVVLTQEVANLFWRGYTNYWWFDTQFRR